MTDTELLNMIEKHKLEVAPSRDPNTPRWTIWNTEENLAHDPVLRVALEAALPKIVARHLS